MAAQRIMPILYPGHERPFLLDTQEFASLTHMVSGSSVLHRVRNRMDVVLVGSHTPRSQPTVRQPLPYVLGLVAEIEKRPGSRLALVAQAYSQTEEAQEKIREGRAFFKLLLDEHTKEGLIFSRRASAILNVGPEYMNELHRKGVFQEHEVVEGSGSGTSNELYLTRSAFERICQWRLPEALRETGVPELPYPLPPSDPS